MWRCRAYRLGVREATDVLDLTLLARFPLLRPHINGPGAAWFWGLPMVQAAALFPGEGERRAAPADA